MTKVYATGPLAPRIRGILGTMPPWFLAAANLAEVAESSSQVIAEQVAMYRHGTRDILVTPRVGNLLERALYHEAAHGVDDTSNRPGGALHAFSLTPAWGEIHRQQQHFEIAKYRMDPKEHFADAVAKALLLGDSYGRMCPRESQFLDEVVFPLLKRYHR